VHDNPAPHLALGLRGDDYVHDLRMEAHWLDQQNQHSRVYNNPARTIAGLSQKPDEPPPESIASHNYQGDTPLLADPKRYDFRPKEGLPLIDAGKHVPGQDRWISRHSARYWRE
jgi:hypothetical protein